MKTINYFIFLTLFSLSGYSQIINIPDAAFKNVLINTNCVDTNNNGSGDIDVDTNNDGEIQVSEALAVTKLAVANTSLTSLAGIQNFANLQKLYCSSNPLGTLDLTGLSQLNTLYCDSCSLTSINLEGLLNLTSVYCSQNLFTTLDFSSTGAIDLGFNSNPNLVYVNMKNGQNSQCIILLNGSNTCVMFDNCPTLETICMDENELITFQYSPPNNFTVFTTYCSFVPGGNYNTITGNFIFDMDNNGCGSGDPFFPNAKAFLTDGTQSSYSFTNSQGNYSFYVGQNNVTITPQIENSSYFTSTPTSYNYNFTTLGNTQTANFCITPNGIHPDLEITLLPMNAARPGFNATYAIIYKNKGTIAQSGTVNLVFEDDVLDFVSSNPLNTNQTVNNLSWDFVNLLPFETREITLTLNVNSPMETPAVNIGDILDYSASITSAAIEETPNNNVFAFHQTVVGSLDPNSKTCVEGNAITPSKVGDYVNYIIHFENSGTYPAESIVVADFVDLSKFDISSLIPTSSSHSYATKITNGNKVEFIFENINLPFDDANNDGYIAFKIKTKSTLVVNDTFTNKANIYFDYNFPIVTNTATTTVQILSVHDFDFNSYFTIYPNPVKNTLNIKADESISIKSISIYNNLGQLVQSVPNQNLGNSIAIDVAPLQSGYYFINIISDKGKTTGKFLKN